MMPKWQLFCLPLLLVLSACPEKQTTSFTVGQNSTFLCATPQCKTTQVVLLTPAGGIDVLSNDPVPTVTCPGCSPDGIIIDAGRCNRTTAKV
jgi:hypothetical protein